MSARIAMFFLGGTISMSSSDGHAVQPTLNAQDLMSAIPGLDAVDADLTGETIAREQSGSLTFDHIVKVLQRARETSADGFVLVQGTDTLEETTYLIDLLWDDPRPFVTTGAMRNPTMAGADGSANMLSAIRVAAAPLARDLGALLVFADEIHAARHVTKSDTASLTTFVSPNTGPLGRVLEEHVHFLNRPTRFPALPQPDSISADVPAVLVTLSQSERALNAVADGVDALVLAGFGAGHAPGWWAENLGAIAARIPVVMTSRTLSGPALVETYGAVGAEVDLQQRGVIMGGYLSTLKARILLCVLVANGVDRSHIEATVRAHGSYR